MNGEEPLADGGVEMVELGGLDEERRDGWRAAGDQLEVAEGGKKGCAAAGATVGVLPALAGLEAESEEEGGELVEGLRGGDGMDEGDSFDHDLSRSAGSIVSSGKADRGLRGWAPIRARRIKIKTDLDRGYGNEGL